MKLYQDKNWMYEQYVVLKRPIKEMAKDAECDDTTIHTWIKRHNLPRRMPKSSRIKHYQDRDWMYEQYVVLKRPIEDMANSERCSAKTIYKWLKHHRTPIRNNAQSCTPEYDVWIGIRNRCNNPNYQSYKKYGGANPPITVEFKSFDEFYAEIGPRPSPKHTVDRYPNGAGNYAPGNVRWATMKEQNRNLKTNRFLTYNGVTSLALELADQHNISVGNLLRRIDHLGWTIDRALTEPINIECRALTNGTTKHGASANGKTSPEYNSWQSMRARCNNPNNSAYPKYGGANPPIKVDPIWDNTDTGFEQFLKDMGPKPSPVHTLDRYPVQAGNYGPDNCRWATRKQQANNSKSNCLYELDDIIRTRTEWAEACGIDDGTMSRRLKKWDLRAALTTPKNPKHLITLDNIAQTRAKWAKDCGITELALNRRLKLWSDLRAALTTPNMHIQHKTDYCYTDT